MSIIIGADFVPTAANTELFENAEIDVLFGEELKTLLNNADYRIFNLEMPLTDKKTPIFKHGPCLIGSEAAVACYAAINVDLLTLANNHIMDQGSQGLESTINLLRKYNIHYVGAGINIYKAREPFCFNIYNKKVGVFACVEHEFSLASETSPGANPVDELDTPDYISELKKRCDYLIILYHGGKEHFRYPSPRLQKLCRKLIDKGADLIVCQHSHCIGCAEKYKSGTIVYGQGNFLFDNSDNECWKTGLLISLDESFQINYIPVVKTNNTVRLASEQEYNEIMEGFYKRNIEITDADILKTRYEEFSDSLLNKYLYGFAGKESVLFRVLNRLTGNRLRQNTLRRKYGRKQFLAIQNFTECEAHRELLLQALKNKLSTKDD